MKLEKEMYLIKCEEQYIAVPFIKINIEAEEDIAAAEDTAAAAPARKHNIFISFGSSDNLNSILTLPLSVFIEQTLLSK